MTQGRFELKYVVDSETKERFLDAIRPEVRPDPHGQNAVYRVSSLYFDTPDYQAVYEKLDGESNRKKYRLRYYDVFTSNGLIKVSSTFMEIKHRIQNTVYKQRAKLSDIGAEKILSNAKELINLSNHACEPSTCPQLTQDIEAAASTKKLQAAKTITYIREAWQGAHDPRLRVTFDSKCQSYAPSCFGSVEDNAGEAILDENLVILEIKFDHSIPCWIRDILQTQHLHLQRFSKYAAGVLSDADLKIQNRWSEIPRSAPEQTMPVVAPVPTLQPGTIATPVGN